MTDTSNERPTVTVPCGDGEGVLYAIDPPTPVELVSDGHATLRRILEDG